MEKYYYKKKEARIGVYKSRSNLLKNTVFLQSQKKIGVLLLIFGIGISVSPLFFQSFSHSSISNVSIINPVPLTELVTGIAAANAAIDKKNPIKNYLSASQGIAESSDTQPFFLSLPSVNMKDIKVTPNVNSTDGKTYETVLQHSTAHFKGTSLPGNNGNVFIYGHSSVTWYHYLNPYSYEGIFSALFDLKIGDKINVTYKQKQYNYVVEGINTIKSNDFSQIQNIKGANTLTLMTCSPPGIGEDRLIIKAIEI